MDLPTDHAPISLILGSFRPSVEEVVSRSRCLGTSHSGNKEDIIRNPIPMHRINHNAFIANLTPTDNLWNYASDLNALCDLITDTLSKT